MRLFTALRVSPEAAREAAAVQGLLREGIDCRNWQNLRNLHLTLNFLGEVESARLAQIKEAIVGVCAGSAPFKLMLGSLGAFPDFRRARVLWLGLNGDRQSLLDLEGNLRRQLQELGLLADVKGYSPHITLARNPSHPDLAGLAASITPTPVDWRVDQVILFKSDLRPTGAIHTVLAEFPLQR